MTSVASSIQSSHLAHSLPLQARIESTIEDLLCSLPDPEQLSAEQRRGIIARYASVLEGNFIYWMTATLLSVKSEESHAIILENLGEEVRDCHPGMMRRFALAAGANPTEADALAVYRDMTEVRLFLGRLLGVQNLLMMGFFEGFIQRFMAYLADLARRQGSSDMEYTDVHGVCDITHSQELFRALSAEMALNPPAADADLFEGVEVLRTLIQTITSAESYQPRIAKAAAAAQ